MTTTPNGTERPDSPAAVERFLARLLTNPFGLLDGYPVESITDRMARSRRNGNSDGPARG